MSQEVGKTELQEQTQQLLQGPLKHVRAAALAAALLPLASVAATPAAAQTTCPSAGICGFVWSDTDADGVREPGEPGISGVVVTGGGVSATTDGTGFYYLGNLGAGTYTVVAVTPSGLALSPSNTGGDDTLDSDGSLDAGGNSSTSVTLLAEGPVNSITDFGFVTPLDQGGDTPVPCDFVTSGGFVLDDVGKKVSFGIHGGCKNGEFWGHVNVLEHATGYHINGEEITGYLLPDGAPTNVREICGSATTNRSEPQPVKFRIRLIDNGEPGSADLMGVRLSNGYHISPRLLSALKPGGGNIQLHDPNPSTTAPVSSPECFGIEAP